MVRKSIPNHILLPQVLGLVAAGEHVKLRVKGRSMIPFLYGGRDEVVLSPFREEDLHAGMIVMAYLPAENRYVLHRIINRYAGQLTLMGDGNVKGVEYCNMDDVKAVVFNGVRNGKAVNFHAPRWLVYARCWHVLMPVRRYLLRVFRLFEVPYCITEKLNSK